MHLCSKATVTLLVADLSDAGSVWSVGAKFQLLFELHGAWVRRSKCMQRICVREKSQVRVDECR